MLLPFNAEIFLYPKPIDFRKQIDGIVEIVADTLDMNPTSGQIFIFRNKLADIVNPKEFSLNSMRL